jgi:dTDP-4-dehydrorhamnose reductase
MAERFAVLGARGMLGRACVESLARRGLACEARARPELEMTDRQSVEAAVPDDATVVVNCAAWTDVDGAEQHEALATRVNGEALAWLSERCAETGALLVAFGTDYVFDGRGTAPYPIDHPLSPINAYGRSKAAGEAALAAGPAAYLWVRTSWLYAPWGKNFVRTMAALGRERELLRVVDDQRGRPTSAQYLAERTLGLIEHGARGIAHVTDGGECTWYQLASAVMQGLGLSCRVEPCTSADMPRPAPRPAYSVLDLSATERLLGPSRDFRANLGDVLAELAPSEVEGTR